MIIAIYIMACGGVFILLDIYSPDLLGGLLATLLLTIAIVLPIHRKKFSYHSIFLVISAIALLLSGIVESAYDTVVRPLPILSQMEFSKFMRPAQVSRGLSHIGFGFLNVLLSLAWLQSKRLSEKAQSDPLMVAWWIVLVLGILYALTGINSILQGLRKL